MKKRYECLEKKHKSNIKCVLVGDSAVGKSCLAARLTTNTFQEQYTPTTFDNYAVTVVVDGAPIVLSLFDTPGQEDFDRLRVLAYMNCDVFFVCFSVVKPDSCKHVEEVWIPEIKHYMPTTPFILVGTQTDMRDSLNASGMDTVSAKEGAELARRVEADCYVEISSRTDSGIQQAIEESIAVALSSAASASKDCDCKCRCQII